jgi:hypothetical protein
MLAVVEGVIENPPDHGKRRFRSEQWNMCFLPEIERADVIQTQNVIGMGMREHHRIQALHSGTERLHPEIGRGVDHNVVLGVLHQNGGSQAVIARVF